MYSVSSDLSSSSLIFQSFKFYKLSTSNFIPRLRKLPNVTCTSQSKPEPKTRTRNKHSMDSQKPNIRNRKRSSYGTSRRSTIKKTFSQEQVKFSTAIPDDPVVGIIGGGMSGLICALHLEKRGVRSTVFDTGVHGLGGRMGTRVIEPEQLIFDHAAQFFTVSDPRFGELVEIWLAKGLIQKWKGIIGELEAGHFVPLPSSPTRYIGANGMRPLADSLLSQTSMIDVVRPCWISNIEPFNGMWHLSENGKPQGQFDAIVIAHNGKCANRLLATSGLPLLAKQMKRLDLSSIWALLAAFDDPLPLPAVANIALPVEGAFVKGIDSISWMGNNTKKLLGFDNEGPNCWTFFSSAAYGKRNKVPQENIPAVTAEKVKENMLDGVELALGLSKGSLQRPFYTRVQLWGAALPTNTPSVPCIFDPHGRAGICGDWLLGSSLESAALSGMALANHIADFFLNRGIDPDEFAVGLHSEFHPLKGHDIGQFPGTESEEQRNEAKEYQLTTSI